ncbi:MAG TPA: alpha/beta hydrolase [Solirubrobacteraceae bacterium]
MSGFLAALTCGALACAPAQAQIAWQPCPESNNIACAKLAVPLDPADPAQGTITLALRRHLAPVGESKDAVIALAGGPGQAAIPFVGQFGQILGPILSTRDLIVFDQRGTGLSHPLSCAAFEHLRGGVSPSAVGICGGQIGSTRGFYTTEDTAADIEAIRQAAGYEKLVLYGTSYGTKVAERYAQEHPSHVEALVLDSVVPPNGPEAFDGTTFAAVRRILRQLCAGSACAHITHNPVGDLARLVKRMGGRSVRGRLIEGNGKAQTTHISSNDLLSILMEGDFDPILRAEFPAAVRAAVRGDNAPLARLAARGDGGEEGEEGEEGLKEGFNVPLYFSTICDETTFPWSRAVNGTKRFREALSALNGQGESAFTPFTASNALSLSDVADCAGWPLTGGPETGTGPLPNVPTLILSGADDLRTPTANAREVADQIPDARLLVVPNTGHSVLGADPTPCAHNALQALFENKPVKACKITTPPALALPTPLPPRSIAEVPAAKGINGLPGRTLGASVLTLGDFSRQILLGILENLGEVLLGSGSVRVGGLRAGWGGIVHGKLELHGYSYVPGVTVSGKISSSGATLTIGGSRAAHGTLKVSAKGTLTGVLGGHPIHLKAPRSTKVGLESSAVFAPSRVSALVANTSRLAALHEQGTVALLQAVFGASR